MQVAEALTEYTAKLRAGKIENPYLEATLLLMHFLKINRTQLLTSPETLISPVDATNVDIAVERRLQGIPMAYILGYKDFYKSRFTVGHGVLIPRPETELIVETAVEKGPFLEMADLGCGSGCIGLSLLGEFKDSRLWACDISEEAANYFEENAKRLNFMDRISFSLGDVSQFKAENRYDLVVANPPYIDRGDDRVGEDVRKHEPGLALFADDNGLAFYKVWLPWAQRALKSGGWVMMEFGEGQSSDISKIAQASGFRNIEIKKDLSGKERVLCAQK
jgi:release factor glutamine methyltransferase